MSLRTRLALGSAVAVAAAVTLVVVATYAITSRVLYGEVDDALRAQAATAAVGTADDRFVVRLPGPFGDATGTLAQAVPAQLPGTGIAALPEVIPVRTADRQIAAGRQPARFRTVEIAGLKVRVYVQRVAPGLAVMLARPLGETESTLARLGKILIAIGLAGIAGAAVLGVAVSRSALRPVRELSATAEEVTRTGDLTRRIPVSGSDELNQLAATVNTMLASLERSVAAQRNLVADASHELRTPLTSIRTNVELLASAERLPKAERDRMLADVVAQLEELTGLVGDLVELGRGEEREEALEDVRLDQLVADAVERVRRRAPDRDLVLTADETLVHGAAARLDRAVVNLLENAIAWGPVDAPVEVDVRDGVVTVRDHGPGIDPDEAERIFDRFYRSPRARSRPGSGLGLAIVRQVAELHGGTVSVVRADGGGARFVLQLPPLVADATSS